MNELGELDRPGRPSSPGAWDARSEEWLVTGVGEMGVRVGGDERVDGDEGASVAEATDGSDFGSGSGSRSGSGFGSGGALREGVDGARAGVGGVREGAGEASEPVERARETPGGARDGLGGAPRKSSGRRGAADPVKALMHRHRDLCERAVDPLEIAAGLEAHGVTDRTAARFRHRDVFSLAEEMYARVSRDGEPAQRPAPPGRPGVRPDWAALALLPGVLCAATVIGVRLTEGQPRLAVAAAGALAVALGLRVAVRRGPLSVTHYTTGATRAWTCWLIAYALLGDGLLGAGVEGGPDGPWPLATAPVLALALACAPAAWCAHFFAVRARRRLTASRGLEEFAASVQPLLLGMFGLYLCALGGLLALCAAVLGEPAAYAGAGALGTLLLLARLLAARGFNHAPAVVLATAGAAEATSLATVFAGRLPGCAFLSAPVETVVGAWGPGAVPALVCGAATLVLLIHSTRTLTRASAHALPCGEA
ncbi:hypothetical protein [Streptomyces sp. NBC_00620]|uniref:hypothetical protein n=1 Tax=Streptomyces sp. NBC_00620 TaxID=2903666 RepID=UPI0022527E78|nr:hypothetical protein [Streptomyces sp. NBC_00620]MCX4971585.1 hypothetical protein [Streptomyces sp. NBC_00620]